ncbi:MAG: alpha/beta hydrolase family protein [Gaiellaceae bacterium]
MDRPRALRATLRTGILIGLALDVPLVAPLVRAVTREPRAEAVTVDGVPSEITMPGGEGPWPAWIFVTGAHPERRREPIVQRLAQALARAGYIVLVPDLPGLGQGEINARTLDSANAAVDFMLRRSDVRGGRVGLCGASTGASVALLAAGRPETADRISVVAAISPWADLAKMVCLATTRSYPSGDGFEPYPAAPLLRRVVARSMLATLGAGDERNRLLAEVGDITREDGDPLERLALVDLDGLGPEARAIVRLLTSSDCSGFRSLCEALPDGTAALLDAMSPLRTAASVRAPVELAVPLGDPYFPPGEAETLAGALRNVRLTVTSTLDHTRPMLSRARPRAFARFSGFVRRGLAAGYQPAPSGQRASANIAR